ncbi:MAG: SBBP repeat-containing protein [Chitinophagaceae bacterium]|nr:SBBP repeat-containing protein [Chitinophagaceae bacterium]
MKSFRSFLIALLSILALKATAQTPSLHWARQIGGEYGNAAYAIATDRNGNVYTTGFFSKTSDFDPGAGVFNMTAVRSSDIFISKLDRNGQFVWARQIGSAEICNAFSMIIDAENNVILIGFFSGSTDFDPGPGNFFLSTKGSVANTCVVKLSPAGDLIWAQQFKSTKPNLGYALATDSENNIWVTGYFQGTADFAGLTLTAQSKDVFITKLNASGHCVWAGQFSGTNSTGSSIALDADKNIYIAGSFGDTLDVDPGPGLHTLHAGGSSSDFFLCKLDAAGNFLWVNQWGNEEALDGAYVATDQEAHVYCTGTFRGKLDFDPGPDTNYLFAQYTDGYVTKLDAAGKVVWTKQFKSVAETGVYPRAIVLEQDGSVLTGGCFTGTADFDPGPGVYTLGAAFPDQNSFICRLDAEGTFKWAQQFEGLASNVIYSLAVDPSANIYAAGSFTGRTDFDAGPGKYYLTPFSDYGDIMIFRLGLGVSNIQDAYGQSVFSLYPNPASGSVTMHTEGTARVSVSTVLGQEIMLRTVSGQETIDVSAWADGIYLVKNLGTQQVIKFIKK